MTDEEKIKLAERLEANANSLIEEAATLRKGLSGGSDSSNFRALSQSHIKELRKQHRKKRARSD